MCCMKQQRVHPLLLRNHLRNNKTTFMHQFRIDDYSITRKTQNERTNAIDQQQLMRFDHAHVCCPCSHVLMHIFVPHDSCLHHLLLLFVWRMSHLCANMKSSTFIGSSTRKKSFSLFASSPVHSERIPSSHVFSPYSI